jgi:hypothetical protein
MNSMKKGVLVISLLLILIVLTGCKPEEIDPDDLIETSSEVEKTLEDSKELESEIVEEITEEGTPDEVLVYNETILLEKSYEAGYNYNADDRKYFYFKDLKINKDYPFIKFKVISEDPYEFHIMQDGYDELNEEYVEFYGGTIALEGYESWLNLYYIDACGDVAKVEKNKYGTGYLYTTEGSCLAYNPNYGSPGILVWNRWGFAANSKNEDIEVKIELYKKKGELPVEFDESYKLLEEGCPIDTSECDVTWQYHGQEKINSDTMGLHKYHCNLHQPGDGRAYERTKYCKEIVEICADYKDNDEDKLMDCLDPDCSEDSYCK